MSGSVTATKKKSVFKIFISMLVCAVMCFSSVLSASAANDKTQDPDAALQEAICNPSDTVKKRTYNCDGGGTHTYTEIVKSNCKDTGYVEEGAFNELKDSEKSKVLEDMNTQAQKKVSDDKSKTSKSKVTNDTVSTWLKNLQNCNGIGSQLMNTLLKNSRPDYATANRIYEPFSGIVGTCLALGAILLMALLGIVMVLDLSYIGIPVFRNFCDGDGDGNGGGSSKPKFISYEAVSAVKQAEDEGGGNGQKGGTSKTAVGLYFKKRVVMLIILGVCLLYLIQGEIYTLVSWILDLLSGFLGF